MKGGGGWSHGRSLRSVTGLLFHRHPPPPPPHASSLSEVCPSSSSAPVAPFAHSLPYRLVRSHFFPCVWLVRASFQPRIYVARRWPCCRGSGRQVACLQWEAGSDGGGNREYRRVGRAWWDSPLLLRSVVRLSFDASLKHN